MITLFRILSLLPLPLLHGIGMSLGWLVYLISPSYRHRLQENIRQAGFESHLARAVSEAGKAMFELPFIWYASPRRVFKKVRMKNWEAVQKILDAQQGIIFLTPHLGCFEITAQVVASKAPLTALYRPPRKKILRPLLKAARTRPNLQLVPTNLAGVRQMLKALKKNNSVGLLPDQVPQKGEGLWSDFFSRPAYTMTLPAKLHQLTGAPIVLSYAERLSWGRGFIMYLIPLDQIHAGTPNDTLEQQTRAINFAMEQLIAYCPAQYLWSYHRYKKPANAPSNIPAQRS